MNSNYSAPNQSVPRSPRHFCSFDRIAALVVYLLAAIFLYSTTHNAPVMVWLALAALLGFTPFYLRRHHIQFGWRGVLLYAVLSLYSLPLILSDADTVRFLSVFTVLFGYLYAIHYLCAGYGSTRLPGEALLLDGGKAVFVMPFSQFGAGAEAVFHRSSGKKAGAGKSFGLVLLGLLLAVIPTMIVTALLSSADSGFARMLDQIHHLIFRSFTRHLFSIMLTLVWAIPLSLYVFGSLWACGTHSCGGGVSAEAQQRTNASFRFAPSALTCAAIVPLLIVYVLFFCAQLQSYLGGFVGSLPENMTYSGYAREGFFQLCTVAVINLLALGAMFLFTRRSKADRLPLPARIIGLLLSAFTLILLSTALAKMLLYISAYGLSRKRVYTLWLMGLLAVIFLLAMCRQFIPRLRLAAWIFAAVILFVGIFLFVDFDRIIADYNVDAYLSGRSDRIDVAAIGDLSASAVPALLRLANECPDAALVEQAIDQTHRFLDQPSPLSTNLSEVLAWLKIKPHRAAFRAVIESHISG